MGHMSGIGATELSLKAINKTYVLAFTQTNTQP